MNFQTILLPNMDFSKNFVKKISTQLISEVFNFSSEIFQIFQNFTDQRRDLLPRPKPQDAKVPIRVQPLPPAPPGAGNGRPLMGVTPVRPRPSAVRPRPSAEPAGHPA